MGLAASMPLGLLQLQVLSWGGPGQRAFALARQIASPSWASWQDVNGVLPLISWLLMLWQTLPDRSHPCRLGLPEHRLKLAGAPLPAVTCHGVSVEVWPFNYGLTLGINPTHSNS